MNRRDTRLRSAFVVTYVVSACGPGGTENSADASGSAGSGSSSTTSASTDDPSTSSSSATGGSEDGSSSETTTGGTPECPDVLDGNLELTDETDIDALRTVHRIRGGLIVENTSFMNLEFLSCLHHIEGSIRIRFNPALETLTGLENVESLSQEDPSDGVQIRSNDALTSLAGLASITTMRRLTVQDNAALTDLGLNALEVLGVLEIGQCTTGNEADPYGFSNDSLTTIEGLASLREGEADIGGQRNLASLGTLHDVAANAEQFSVWLWHNPELAVAEIESIGGVGCGNQGFEGEECICPNPG